jgi:glycosyltransferase involved in cell wall biosynthesis
MTCIFADKLQRMFQERPLISVGMPVYNGEQLIRQALRTFLEQTYEQFEIIISDNASSDNTRTICLEYCAKDSRIHYYRNSSNIGVYANFRRVLELARGEYFMWAGVDDLRPADALEICLKALLKNKKAVMAHGPVLSKGKGTDKLVEVANDANLSYTRAASRVRAFIRGIEHNAILYGLYRRKDVTKGTFGSCLGQDYLLGLQMCLLGPIEYVHTPIIICQERRTRRNDNPMYSDSPITLLDCLRGRGPRNKKCWIVLLMGLLYLGKIEGVALSERIGALAAHLQAFAYVYSHQLVKELVLQAFSPITIFSLLIWRLTRRWQFIQKLHGKLTQI